MKDVAHKLIICRQLGIPAVATFGGKAFNNNDYEKESDMMKNYNEYIDTGDYDEYLRNKRSLNSDAKTM